MHNFIWWQRSCRQTCCLHISVITHTSRTLFWLYFSFVHVSDRISIRNYHATQKMLCTQVTSDDSTRFSHRRYPSQKCCERSWALIRSYPRNFLHRHRCIQCKHVCLHTRCWEAVCWGSVYCLRFKYIEWTIRIYYPLEPTQSGATPVYSCTDWRRRRFIRRYI